MVTSEKKHPDHLVSRSNHRVSFGGCITGLMSYVHKIFFAVWFEFEDMDWCLTVVWKMSSNSD